MSYPLFLTATRDDHRSRTLIAARLLALRLLAPWRYRMATCCSTPLTTTVGVIDRVHHHTSNCRTNSAPTHGTGFTNFAKVMLTITNFTNRRTAFDVNSTNFTRTQTYLCISSLARH